MAADERETNKEGVQSMAKDHGPSVKGVLLQSDVQYSDQPVI